MKHTTFLSLIISFLLLANLSIVKAEIITDGTVGPTENLKGPNFIIAQELGSRVGNNLFHSFKTFAIKTNNGVSESATFTGSSDITNVISRVTGGQISTINGLLKSEVGQADFYFLNPAGVMFGANAKVDVPAAFHVSTADELHLGDGSIFSASNAAKSTLGMAQPEAFGFLDPQPASIIINGSQLEFSAGSKVSLVAGNIELQNSSLISETGSIQLVAQGTDNTPVLINGASTKMAKGNLITNSSTVDVSGDGSGHLELAAGFARLDNSQFFNLNSAAKNAIQGTEIEISTLNIINGTQISSINLGKGKGAAITVHSDNLTLDSQKSSLLTGIVSRAYYNSSSSAGDINIEVNGLLEILNGATISSDTLSEGDSGAISIDADNLKIDSQNSEIVTGIKNFALANSSGNTGRVNIKVKDSLEMLNRSTITNITFGKGNADSVTVHAGNLIINSQDSNYFSWIGSDTYDDSSGNAGNVRIGDSMTLFNL